MIKLAKAVPKILIACHEGDKLANDALQMAALALMRDTGLSYTWQRAGACDIGKVETAYHTPYPVFMSCPSGLDLSAFEGRNGCAPGAGIMVMAWEPGGELRSEKPRRFLRPGLLSLPIAGMKKAIIVSSDERYEGNGRRILLDNVAGAIIGAVASPDYSCKVLFARQLRQQREAVKNPPRNELAACV